MAHGAPAELLTTNLDSARSSCSQRCCSSCTSAMETELRQARFHLHLNNCHDRTSNDICIYIGTHSGRANANASPLAIKVAESSLVTWIRTCRCWWSINILRWEAGACSRMDLDWTASCQPACSVPFPWRWKSTNSRRRTPETR